MAKTLEKPAISEELTGAYMLCMRRTKTTNPFIVFLVVVNGEQLMMLSVVDISVFVAFVWRILWPN